MKTAISYFRYKLKTNLRPLIVISICVLILGFYLCAENMAYVHTRYYNDALGKYVQVTKEYPNGYYYENGHMQTCTTPTRAIEYRDTVLSYPVTILCITSFIVPVWIFASTKKRKNLDCYYSLPISRRAFFTADYLLGLVLTFVPFLLSYLQNLLLNALASFDMFLKLDFSALAIHFLICIIMGLVLYTLFVFVFNEANSVTDGCIFMLTYALYGFFWLMATTISDIFYNYSYFLDEEMAMPWIFFPSLLTRFENVIELQGITSYYLSADTERLNWLILYVAIGILCVVGFCYRCAECKAEKTEDISDTVFGYKTLIPLMAIPAVIVACMDSDTIVTVFITLAAVVAYTVYRRGVKYKLSDYIVMGILLFFTVTAAIKA